MYDKTFRSYFIQITASIILSSESRRTRPTIIAFDLKWHFVEPRVHFSVHCVCIFLLKYAHSRVVNRSNFSTFPHRAFIDVFAWYAERFMGVSILLARCIKTARYSTTISVYLVFLSSSSPRFSNCFSCSFYSSLVFPRLVTNEIFQRNSREHPGEKFRFAIETSRHKTWSLMCSPVVKPIARYIGGKPGIIRIIISARLDQTIAVYFVDVRKHAHVPVWTTPRSRCTHSGLTVTAFDAARRFIKFRVLNERHRGITRAICLFVP